MPILTDEEAALRLKMSPLHKFFSPIVAIAVTARPEGCTCISPDFSFSYNGFGSQKISVYCVCGAANRDNG